MPFIIKDPKEQPTSTSTPMAQPAPQAPTAPTITAPSPQAKTPKGPGTPGRAPSPTLVQPQAPSAANGFGDQSSLTPQTANQAGTGYVNLNRVLGANLGAGEGLLSSANKKLGGAFSARTGAESQYVQDRETARRNSAAGRTVFQSPDILGNALESGDMTGLARGLKGLDLERFGYNANANADMQDLRGLASGQTAGRVLARDAGVTGGYSPRLSALDALIYGGNSAAAGSVSATKDAYGNEVRAGRESADRINTETDALRQTAADAAARNEQTLRGIATGYKDRAQQAADQANATRVSDIANGIMRDEFGNEIGRVDPNGPAPVWEGNNENATAGNFYQGGKDVQTIAQLLGDPSLVMQNTGPYRSGVLRQDQQNVADLRDLATERRDAKREAERMRDQIRNRDRRSGSYIFDAMLDPRPMKVSDEDRRTGRYQTSY